MRDAERVLVHGALGGLAAGFPGIARQLGASRVVGTVRASDLDAAQRTKLPYDEIIDSAELPTRLAGERFEIIIDPVGGSVRTASIELLAPGRRSLPRSQSWPAGAVRSSSDWTDCLVRSCCHLTPATAPGALATCDARTFTKPNHRDTARREASDETW